MSQRVNARAVAKVAAALKRKAMTARAVAKETGLSLPSVYKYVRLLQEQGANVYESRDATRAVRGPTPVTYRVF